MRLPEKNSGKRSLKYPNRSGYISTRRALAKCCNENMQEPYEESEFTERPRVGGRSESA
jgi:hypothetical protein